MDILAEMLIPQTGRDDFNQPAKATATFLRYRLSLELTLSRDSSLDAQRICLLSEELRHITKRESRRTLVFGHSPTWRDSVVQSSRRVPFISTEDGRVRLHADRMRSEGKTQQGGGRPSSYLAASLPRTVLSSAQNADEHSTAVLVREEMRRWRHLHLEPSALRQPDDFEAPASVDSSGAHVPAALYRIAHSNPSEFGGPAAVYAETANRLSELLDGVRSVSVVRDDSRRLLQFVLRDRSGADFPAGALSDGTLRFIAQLVIEQDAEAAGVLCLEEPENGIHPQRIGPMLKLLYDIATETTESVGPANPLRQVVMTTHSPLIALGVRPEDLVFVGQRRHRVSEGATSGVQTIALAGSWRSIHEGRGLPMAQLLDFLGGRGRVGSDLDVLPPRSIRAMLRSKGTQLPLF